MKLWPHQDKAIAMVNDEFARGAVAVCLVMSTGAGKTRTAVAMVKEELDRNPTAKIVWVTHRDELVGQAYDDLNGEGISTGVIQSRPSRPVNPYRFVQVASTQTLLARGSFPDATLVVLDEVHHYASDTWAEIAREYRRRGARLLGLTATPVRADRRGFEGFMDALVVPISMKELIVGGFLTPFTLIAPRKPLGKNRIALRPVDAYLKHAKGRKTVVFAGNIVAAELFKRQFDDAGIACGMVTGVMELADRRHTLDAFKKSDLTVLTNVGVLTEGFDDRGTSCVILARPVGSLALYLQTCGRALRASPETGKTDAIILDLYGSCRRGDFGSPDDDREWTLEGDGIVHKKLERSGERFCLVCESPIIDEVCDVCATERPQAQAPEIANVALVKYAAKRREPEDIRRAYFTKLKAEAKLKRWSPWAPVMKYQAIYGEKPPPEWMRG